MNDLDSRRKCALCSVILEKIEGHVILFNNVQRATILPYSQPPSLTKVTLLVTVTPSAAEAANYNEHASRKLPD